MNSWKCDNCGYLYDGGEPPEKCPSCGKTCEFREVTNYVPEMEREGRKCVCNACGTEIEITEDKGGIIKCCDQPMKLK